MKHLVDHSWFYLLEFISITSAVILWIKYPGLSWQPLLIPITPLLLRVVAFRPPFVQTPLDIPIAIFLLTAGVGIWAAYQPEYAWIKFWFILASILFYYHLARQPAKNLWTVAVILCLMGFGISIYFFLSNNWEVQPQKFQLLSQIGMAWMQVRPNFTLASVHPNDIAGLVVITLPFSVALTIQFRRRENFLLTILFGLISCLIFITILLSASRGAWMAVGITAGLWSLWVITSWFSRYKIFSHRILFIVTSVLLVCLAFGYMYTSFHGRLNKAFIGQAGASVSDQRAHLFWSSIQLIKDVPITGGGLDSFPGLYSSYILIDPNYILPYSHNLYLDVSLYQGILGGIMLCCIILGSIILLALQSVPTPHSLLRYAILSGLVIISIHGLLDNIIYSTMSTTLLFFLPGMAVGLITSTNSQPERILWRKSQVRSVVAPVFITLGMILIGLISFRRPLLSAWYTDLGSVEMAKVELSDFPTGIWDEGQHADLLSPAESLFNRALIYEPTNPRANYRLGLIAMLKRDFPTAVNHLEIAHRGDTYHRGMLKALGFSYLWNGQIEAALPLLSLIPESDYEVGNYTYWWSELDRPDLVAYAEQYLEMVGSRQK